MPIIERTTRHSRKVESRMLDLQYENMTNTLRIFGNMDFSEAGNTYRDANLPISDRMGAGQRQQGYYLFPTSDAKNGGYVRPNSGGATKQTSYRRTSSPVSSAT